MPVGVARPPITPVPLQESHRTFPPESHTRHCIGSDIPMFQIVFRPEQDGQVRLPAPKQELHMAIESSPQRLILV